jgi:REP element-mobilizing transposase RayT
MARAKRHYIAGHIWHITHRCHKREFLLKFSKDRRRYLQWLWEAKKRYGMVILNYIVTSNHVHLLVADDSDRMTIPRSIQLVAGRTGLMVMLMAAILRCLPLILDAQTVILDLSARATSITITM